MTLKLAVQLLLRLTMASPGGAGTLVMMAGAPSEVRALLPRIVP